MPSKKRKVGAKSPPSSSSASPNKRTARSDLNLTDVENISLSISSAGEEDDARDVGTLVARPGLHAGDDEDPGEEPESSSSSSKDSFGDDLDEAVGVDGGGVRGWGWHR
mgnify:CR=1 FL=1